MVEPWPSLNVVNPVISRRNFLIRGVMRISGLLGAGNLLCWQTPSAQSAPLSSAEASPDPAAALQALMAGNQRFVDHSPQHPHQSSARLEAVAHAQQPFATILSCADSRVPVEILFDQGVGDIFDVRVAGNVVTPATLGSLEYAVAVLNIPVLMVLGHERCGAVTAAVQNQSLPGDISSLIEAILPAVERVKEQPGNEIDNTVIANVQYQIEQLKRSSLITERLESGQLKLVGGRYDLDTGRVRLLISNLLI